MTNLETAIAQFAALNRAMVEFWKGNAAEPVDADYGYKHEHGPARQVSVDH